MTDRLIRRHTVLGFGTSTIDDVPITLSAVCARACLMERVYVVGASAAPITLRMDGRPIELVKDHFGPGYIVADTRLARATPGTRFELTIKPLKPRAAPKWWQFWRRRRAIVSASAKVIT